MNKNLKYGIYFTATNSIECTYDEFNRCIGQYNLIESLRFIGIITAELSSYQKYHSTYKTDLENICPSITSYIRNSPQIARIMENRMEKFSIDAKSNLSVINNSLKRREGSEYIRKTISQNKQISYIYSESIINEYSNEYILYLLENYPALAFISMRLLNESNDYKRKILDFPDLGKLILKYHGLPESNTNISKLSKQVNYNLKFKITGFFVLPPYLSIALFYYFNQNDYYLLNNFFYQSISEYLLRQQLQFEFQNKQQYDIPRTLLLFDDELWKDQKVTPSVDLNIITKLGYLDIIAVGLSVCGALINKHKQGYISLSSNVEFGKCVIITLEIKKNFLEWLSIDYKSFREKLKKELQEIGNDNCFTYQKYVFNPLQSNPIIEPDIKKPDPTLPPVYLVPIFHYMLKRITRGIFYDLSNYYTSCSKDNDFRISFGKVFEKYIKILFKNCTSNLKIYSEYEYGKKGTKKMTPDLLVVDEENSKIVFIEAKASGLYKLAKTTGDLKEIRDDLKKTIAKGVGQLYKFEENLDSGLYNELQPFSKIKHRERVVVIYDNELCFLNSIIKTEIRSIPNERCTIPSNYHYHIMTIDELEDMLGFSDDFFNVLNEKNKYMELDFHNFYQYLNQENLSANKFLLKIQNIFLDSLLLIYPKNLQIEYYTKILGKDIIKHHTRIFASVFSVLPNIIYWALLNENLSQSIQDTAQ